MERNCFCCSPDGPSPVQPSSRLVPSPAGRMDVDSALCELDDLQSVTSSIGAMSCSSDTVHSSHGERKPRMRSLSESQASSMPGPSRSHSESSFFQKRAHNGIGRTSRRFCLLGTKMLCGSSSLPRKLPGYQLVQKNSAYVSDIVTSSTVPTPLLENPSFPPTWNSLDSGRGSYSENTSELPPCPSSMVSYRDSDVLEERSRYRRLARVRLDRSRRLRQPYLIPLRMCQSMQEDSLTGVGDLLSEANYSQGSKSTTASPVKQESDQGLGTPSCSHSLVRSRSFDNLALARLRLTDAIEAKSDQGDPQAVDQVATGLKNLQMV
ncbi:hypothetical protein BaRGS_00021442 [Batillaria attramentaria]|uniref:Uncharacterized protein n=1 Tax=Batillaria attramentaria TaxID=370345 RepID=A0ABD0KK14_9CAEN